MARLTATQREELAALRRIYSDQLPKRLQAIEAGARSLQREWARDGVESLYHLAHRLAGSSAIYGFDSVSRAAAALEACLADLMEGAARPADESRAELATFVHALTRAFARETGRGDPAAKS